MSSLLFDEETHTYTMDGVVVPSVTQIIAAAGLSDFSMVKSDDLEYAIQKGKAIHKAIELDLNGKLDKASIDPVIEKYFEQWEKYQLGNVNEMVGEINLERPLYHNAWRFAGTPDLWYRKAKYPILVDIKTGAKTCAAPIQTAGYSILISKEIGVPESKIKRIAVYLTENDYKIEHHKDDSDYVVFRSALNLFHFKKEKGIKNVY